jgi:K+-sensing histidine kinase KdpD
LNENSSAGLGVGVSIVNKLVNKMDGEIEIKSEQASKKHSGGEIEAGTKVTI